MRGLRIGIDFDNTIACYDTVFYKAALEKNWIPKDLPSSKSAVRNYLRSIGKEEDWTELQGYVYGSRMDLVQPFPGIDRFLSLCREKQIPTFIISHKTLYPFLGPRYDLHQSARNWHEKQSFCTMPAFFETTLQNKLRRIGEQQCTHFIDDLPELLAEPEFPSSVQKILFDPNRIYPQEGDYLHTASWLEIEKKILGWDHAG